MISDGMSPSSMSFARVGLGKDKLFIDDYFKNLVKTYSASSSVTDSAAAATAYSTGFKTTNDYVGVMPNKTAIGTFMEAARDRGMLTGCVVTSRITHATPASFTSHTYDRNQEEYIAAQQSFNGSFDILLGGGLDKYNFTSNVTWVNTLDETLKQGKMHVVFNTDELNQAEELPILGLFAPSHMSYVIDRDLSVQPSLMQMAAKALDLFSKSEKNKNGFVLLVEGSLIDIAAHHSDAAAHLREIEEYDTTFQQIIEWAKKDGETLIISVSDHGTGGISTGKNFEFRDEYALYDWFPDYITKVNMSLEKMGNLIWTQGLDAVEVVKNYTGIDPNPWEIDNLNLINSTSYEYNKTDAIAFIVNNRAHIGFTTWGHIGVDVNLYGYGPGIEKLNPYMNNIDVNKMVKELFDFNLEEVTYKLAGFDTTGYTFYDHSQLESMKHRRRRGHD